MIAEQDEELCWTAVLARDTRVAQGDETQDPVSEVDSIVVTGFRASLSSALTTKRRANGVVDVIKAEDMASGLEPDNSIDPEKLSEFERKSLRDAFLILGNAQKFLKYRYQPGRAN